MVAGLAGGCSTPTPSVGGTGVPDPAHIFINQPVEPLGGRAFTSVTASNARYAGGTNAALPGTDTASPQTAQPAPTAGAGGMTSGTAAVPAPIAYGGGSGGTVDGMVSGNMQGGYGYMGGPGYGGNGTPTTLVSITQNEGPGAKGPYLKMLETVVAPILKDWSYDARLTSSSATTGGNGLLSDPPAGSGSPTDVCGKYYSPGNESSWRLTYYSIARSEMLNFNVSADKTVIIRMRWAPLDLAAVPITIDNDTAITNLINAIKTPGFQSEEQKNGTDYFLGVAFNNTCANGYAMPIRAGGESRIEVIYDVPVDARWNTNLQVVLGKPVWQLNYYANSNYTMPYPVPMMATGSSGTATAVSTTGAVSGGMEPGFYFQNSAGGEVDARTGAVIRFSRPSKQYYQQPIYGTTEPAKVDGPTPAKPTP